MTRDQNGISKLVLQTGVIKELQIQDEDNYENEIFSILSTAHARNDVILAGKCGSRRQSTTSFSENVVVAKQVIKCQKFYHLVSDRERALPPLTEISELTFVVQKSTMKLSGMSILRE